MRRFVQGGFALVLVVGMGGCGNHSGDLTNFVLDGPGTSALLFADVQPAAPGDSSRVSVFGVIYDRSVASGFRLYVNPAGAGFRPATDFVADPTKTYSTGMNEYRIRSLVLDPDVYNEYVGRGARRGLETAAAPLTEAAGINALTPPLLLARRLDVALLAPVDSAFTDSIPTLSWDPVPGATRYQVRITGRNGANYLAIVTGTTHQVEVDPSILIEDIPLRPGQFYRWEVEAIDAGNRIIGKTADSNAMFVTGP